MHSSNMFTCAGETQQKSLSRPLRLWPQNCGTTGKFAFSFAWDLRKNWLFGLDTRTLCHKLTLLLVSLSSMFHHCNYYISLSLFHGYYEYFSILLLSWLILNHKYINACNSFKRSHVKSLRRFSLISLLSARKIQVSSRWVTSITGGLLHLPKLQRQYLLFNACNYHSIIIYL